MANYYNINRSIEAYEFLTIDPDDGQLKNILDISGSGNAVDLSNYYTKPETDTLLSGYYDTSEMDVFLTGKLSVLNPSVSGNLTVTGTVNGADVVLTSSMTCDSLNTNTLYTNKPTENIWFGHTDALSATTIYMEYDYDYDNGDVGNPTGGLVMGVPLVLAQRLDVPLNSQLHFQHTDSYINETLNSGNFLNYVMREQAGQMDFYVGDPATASNKVMTLKNDIFEFNKPTNLALGGDTSNCVKLTGETDQRIDGTVSVNGDTVTGYELTVNGQIHSQGMFVATNTNLIFGSATRYITNPPTSNHIRHYTNGEHQFYCNGVEDFLIDQDKALARGNMLCVGQFQGSIFNSYNNNSVDVSFRKTNLEYIKLCGDLSMVEMPRGVRCDVYNTIGNVDATFKRNSVDFFYLRNNTVDLNAGITLQTSSAKIDTIDTVGDNDLAFKRNNDSFMSFSQATGKIFLQKDTEIQGDATFVANKTVKVDNIDTVGNNDLIFKCNNVEYFKLNETQNIIDVATGRALSSQYIYGDFYRARNFNADMVFEGGNATGDGRVEIFRYEYANEQLNFNTAINNTGRPVIGNIQDTSVSDEKLKKDIEDVDVDVSGLIKKVNVKSFEYKHKKYGVGKQIGFLANELLDELPEVFSKNIIGKDKEDNLNMNYIKINTVLWKCNQELINKVEHLESRLFEVENFIKDYVKPKPKAKAKAKN